MAFSCGVGSVQQKFFYKKLLMREHKLLGAALTASTQGQDLEESNKTQYQALNNLLMQVIPPKPPPRTPRSSEVRSRF